MAEKTMLTEAQMEKLDMSQEDFDAMKAADQKKALKGLELDPEAEDALGVDKNVVGSIHDRRPADNSPVLGDDEYDHEASLAAARNEGFENGKAEHPHLHS